MPLQNRVTPYGGIIAHAGRGTLMGNRGTLCEEAGRLKRQWQTRRWITCLIDFGGRRRTVMQPQVWTAIFFLDEATAFAAGHRPCAYCRRDDYKRFQSLWVAVHGAPADANAMDAVMDADRRNGCHKRTYQAAAAELPAGVFITIEGSAWLLGERAMMQWSMEGYGDRRPRPTRGTVDVITPRALAGIIAGGYSPRLHPSAL